MKYNILITEFNKALDFDANLQAAEERVLKEYGAV